MKILVVLLFVFLTNSAFAGYSDDVNIVEIFQDENFQNYMALGINGEVQSRPADCVNPTYQYAIDLTTEYGKRIQSTLLMAFAAGKKVSLIGTGQCNINNVEVLRRVVVKF
ncbi:hypothetical protein [Teredinibacter sp. KSP-S5-2]|uniref:hypothetical protein n=1 Tax=Teredinibacter sp. KSP-S5-2 TaxID=3034506 RepID=UPI002934D7BE|nr:hypothetical protein [Teredinibacter sp. KSP-S5-2]WNO11161.1 hypothetical protein P5V12_08245 [Teredinibacter sp. KSP-S5-2]